MDSTFREQLKRYKEHESWINYILHDLDLSGANIFYRFVKRLKDSYGKLGTCLTKPTSYYITLGMYPEIETTIMHELYHVKQRETKALVSVRKKNKWITVWNDPSGVTLYFDDWVYKQRQDKYLLLPWEQDAKRYEETYQTVKAEYEAKEHNQHMISSYLNGRMFVGRSVGVGLR